MSAGLSQKISILFKAIKTVKNWNRYIALYFNRIKSDHVVLEMRNGIKIKLRVNSTDIMAFTNVWLVEEYSKPGFEIKDNDVVIDIGAHIGLFALYISQFCKTGKIYCFEPIKENFDVLTSNIMINNITNIICMNTAVSANNGLVTIYLNEDQAGHSMHVTSSKKIEAESVSLQHIFDSNLIENCNLLKIDCEGEEYSIMRSLPSSYYTKIKKICMEYHLINTSNECLNELTERLLKLTFKIIRKETAQNMGFLYASR